MSEEDRKYISELQVKELCRKGHRVLAFGYKDMTLDEFEAI